MGRIRVPDKAKLVMALMAGGTEWMDRAKMALREAYGEIDAQSEVYPFDFTDYYQEEMGKELQKQFISFAPLISMELLPQIKLFTNRLEEELGRREGDRLRRRVNIDPGYLTGAKLVLASTKDYAHRLYLGRGIFAEVTLLYRGGKFEHLDWTYPDYRTELAKGFFRRVREIYLRQMRSLNPFIQA